MKQMFVFSALICLCSLSWGQAPTDPFWDNPYPGLGNAAPGTAPMLSRSAAFYPVSETMSSAELVPTLKNGNIYLSQNQSRKRTGMFQKLSFNALWAPDTGGHDGLGVTELDIAAMFAVPMLTPESPLLITPSFKTTFFDVSGTQSDPFYTTGLNFQWIRPLVKDKLTALAAFSALYSGDFESGTGDAMRFPAHVAGIWQFNPRTKIIFGVLYTDRKSDYKWLPMGGVIWTPNDDWKVEVIFPKAKIAKRFHWFDSPACGDAADWFYAAMEFGGDSWRRNEDWLDYQDTRLLLGYERQTRIGSTIGLELGLLCGRKISVNDHSALIPADSLFLRLRTAF